jgi:hypothetical protein
MAQRRRGDDYEQIRSVLTEVENSVRAKSVRGCLKYVSDDYRDEYGNDRHELWRLALEGLRQPEPISLVVNVRGIKLEPRTAEADLLVDFETQTPSGTRGVRDVPVMVRFRREGRQWKIIYASGYERAGEAFDS